MDTAQWPQEIVVKPMEEMIVANTCSSSVTTATACSNVISNNINNHNNNNNSNGKASSTALERKVRPQKDQALTCPRCNSTTTKFCYYNNYSLTQPRYFCKTCRRYWTEGGSLRNIPVGGGSRKNKRSSSSSSSSSSSPASKKLSHDHFVAHLSPPNPKNNIHLHHQGQDLNLGFTPTHQEFRSLSEFIQLPNLETNPARTQIPDSASAAAAGPSSGANATDNHLSALELLNGLTSSRGLTPFMPMPVTDPNGVYSSGLISLHDFKPTLSFSLDGLGNGYGSLSGGVQVQQQDQETTNNGRLLFPFEDSNKPVSSNTTSADHDNTNNNTAANEQARDQQGDSTGYWTGMLGTGGSW